MTTSTIGTSQETGSATALNNGDFFNTITKRSWSASLEAAVYKNNISNNAEKSSIKTDRVFVCIKQS